MAAQTIYRLKYPVALQFRQGDGEIREESITEIKLRRPTAKELRLADSFGERMVGMMIAMISALSGEEETTVERIDAEDFGELAELIEGFLPDGQKTGETS